MSDPYTQLEQALGRWPDTLAVTRPQIDEVARNYAQPPRAYHGFSHILELAQHYAQVRDSIGWDDPATVFAAMLFHDIVYMAGCGDNESRSAEHAVAAVSRFGWSTVDEGLLSRLINGTAAHGRHGDVPSRDARHFFDIDMAILAAKRERFEAYEAQIAEEYRALPKDAYIAGRRRFLEGLLEAERIYLSEYFHERLDRPARDNLRRTLGGGEQETRRAPDS